jgi:hypothetical protein
MSEISVQGVGAMPQKRAHSRPWRRPLKTALVTNPLHERASRRGALRGGWLVNRLACAVRGHRQLVATAATARILPGNVRREIFLCHACDSYTWKTTPNGFVSNWSEVGV